MKSKISASTMRGVKRQIAELGVDVARRVAARAAPAVTSLAGSAWDSGRNVYGDSRPLGVAGNQLSLVRTGAARSAIAIVQIGASIACSLGVPYARYLIGRYKILPVGDRTGVPWAWRSAISAIAKQEVAKDAAAVGREIRRAA